jgi:hypothetical protein
MSLRNVSDAQKAVAWDEKEDSCAGVASMLPVASCLKLQRVRILCVYGLAERDKSLEESGIDTCIALFIPGRFIKRGRHGHTRVSTSIELRLMDAEQSVNRTKNPPGIAHHGSLEAM